MTLDIKTPAKQAFLDPKKYTFKSPNLRRYEWMSRVNISFFLSFYNLIGGEDRRDPGEFSKKTPPSRQGHSTCGSYSP